MITASKRWSFLGVGSERLEAVGVEDEDEVELEVTVYGDIRFLTVNSIKYRNPKAVNHRTLLLKQALLLNKASFKTFVRGRKEWRPSSRCTEKKEGKPQRWMSMRCEEDVTVELVSSFCPVRNMQGVGIIFARPRACD